MNMLADSVWVLSQCGGVVEYLTGTVCCQPHLRAAELIWQHGAHREVLLEVMINGNADAWCRRIDDQRACGQSVWAGCGSNGSQECSFYWRRSRLGLSPKKRRPSKPV